jgi:transposase
MNRKGYPSDLTDAEWEMIKDMVELELPYPTGRPAQVDDREIWNAIFYMDYSGPRKMDQRFR